MAREPINRKWNEVPDAPNQYEEPNNATWEDGWRGGANEEPPEAKYQNWWQRRVDDALQDIEQRGAMSWVPNAIYGIGAYARGSDGNIYRSLENDNTNVNPVGDVSGAWESLSDYIAALIPVQELLIDIGTPAGTIIHFGGNTAPAGYLACNGSAVSRATYSRLFSAIGTQWGSGDGSTTFNLPDARGEFLRGWDNGRGVDGGRAFASSQSFAIQSHDHSMTFRQGSEGDGGITDRNGFLGIFSDTDQGQYTNTVAIDNTGGSETRPRNIATLICIKF